MISVSTQFFVWYLQLVLMVEMGGVEPPSLHPSVSFQTTDNNIYNMVIMRGQAFVDLDFYFGKLPRRISSDSYQS